MSHYKIRIAMPEDMPQVVLIKNIAWVYAYQGIMSNSFLLQRTNASQMQRTIQKWQHAVHDEVIDKIFFVAENENNEIVGFAFGGDVSQSMVTVDKELHALYVHPIFHGRGVGKALLQAFAKWVRQQDKNTFCVGCLTANKSLAFYKHMGGRVLCEINNPHFEHIPETFFIYHAEDVLNINKE